MLFTCGNGGHKNECWWDTFAFEYDMIMDFPIPQISLGVTLGHIFPFTAYFPSSDCKYSTEEKLLLVRNPRFLHFL